MAEYFKRESLIKAICEIGDDSKGGWSTSSIVDFLLNQPVANAETLQQVSKAIAPLAIAKNEGVAETINTLLRGTSLENVFDSLVRNYGRVDK